MQESAALTSALRTLLASLPADSLAACITLWGGPPAYWYSPDASFLREVQVAHRRVVSNADCPHTYGSMMPNLSASDSVRPAGYVDPYRITVRHRPEVTADSSVVHMEVNQGTLNHDYTCVSRRDAGGRWMSTCLHTSDSISALPRAGSLATARATRYRPNAGVRA
ncbi:MAG: hypothetical protein ABJA80_08545 [bacterium]